MAVTHADLEPSRRRSDLGSKTGAFFMILSILFGLLCFILCLIAEATHSQVIWVRSDHSGGGECTYTSNGKTPLMYGVGAFGALAIAMVTQHTYMLYVVSKSPAQSMLMTWDPHSHYANRLAWQAGIFFLATWVFFAVGEILLLIGLSVESGHLKNWLDPRPSCLVLRQGIFTAAGVFGLSTVFLATGLYITALQAQRLLQELENVRREVVEASALYASPPLSPLHHHLTTAASEINPIVRNSGHEQSLAHYLSAYDKRSNLV